jgi:hypothetical protein
MLKDEIEKKNQLRKSFESTRLTYQTHIVNHETEITQ